TAWSRSDSGLGSWSGAGAGGFRYLRLGWGCGGGGGRLGGLCRRLGRGIGLGPRLVGLAAVVGLVEARALEQDRRARADLAAELRLPALGADRLGFGRDRLE